MIWLDRLPLFLSDVVTAYGGTISDGWILEEVTVISPEGAPEAFPVVFSNPL